MRQPTRLQWLTAEKSPAAEMETIVHVTRRDEGIPPYRRLRRESYPLSFRALVEKSPAAETETIVHDYPEYSPAAAHRLACAGSAPCLRRLTAAGQNQPKKQSLRVRRTDKTAR